MKLTRVRVIYFLILISVIFSILGCSSSKLVDEKKLTQEKEVRTVSDDALNITYELDDEGYIKNIKIKEWDGAEEDTVVTSEEYDINFELVEEGGQPWYNLNPDAKTIEIHGTEYPSDVYNK